MEKIDGSEKVVLAWAMMDGHLAKEVCSALEQEMFYASEHKEIYAAVKHLIDTGAVVDVVSVGQALKARDKLGEVGGPTYLTEVMDSATVREHFDYHVSEVRKAHYGRKIVEQALRIAEDPDDSKIQMMQQLALAREAEKSGRYFDFRRDLPGYLDSLETIVGQETIDTGFKMLDKLLGGLYRGDLVTISGRPGGGKTAFVTKLAVNLAEQGKVVLVFSTEMHENQFVNRVMPAKTRIPAWKFRKIAFDLDERQRLHDACSAMHEKFGIVVCDIPRPSLGDIRKAAMKYKPDLIIVDYLQRCAKPRAENVTRSVDDFMTQLKTLCREHNFVGVLGCQMSRSVDHSKDLPKLSDLRDSGAVEAESDQVILLHEGNKDDFAPLQEIAALVQKNRHGQSGVVQFVLQREFVEMREA